MLILGIDPGVASTGYGLVSEREGKLQAVSYGVISTPSGLPTPARLQIIYRQLTALIAEHRPSAGAMEKLFFSRNVSTAMSVGQARGVSLLALADSGLEVAEYTPNEVKQAIAGYGNADKGQMQEMVRLLLGLDTLPRPDDAADALAVAICHLHAARYQSYIEE